MSQAKLYLRCALPDGRYRYGKAVFASNGRLKPHVAVIDGKPQHHPSATYHIRYADARKRIWEPVGSDPSLAVVALQRKNYAQQGIALGLKAAIDTPAPQFKPETTPQSESPKHSLKDASNEYLSEVEEHKSPTTFDAYSRALKKFIANCPHSYLEEIERKDILAFQKLLRSEGREQRTIANTISYLKIFFNHFSIKWPMLKTDKVKYVEKEVSAYNVDEIRRLLAAANREESDLLQFFLCTGARDLEVVYATWRDIDFTVNTFSITEKVDFHWKPKDGEEGAIPIPDSLVALLQDRRRRYPTTRLIFPADKGGPNLHFLRTVKRLALRAGLNCGFCQNKAGKSCAKSPICDRFGLHKFRKTFATMHHEAGVPVRTIQRWLRHSDLETTLRYLAATDDKSEMMRTKVNATFAAFDAIGGAA